MREADVTGCRLVKAGVPCTVDGEVDTNTLVQMMRSEDKYIYWFQSTDTQTQVSCVYVNEKYYSMPLRLEKAVFKNVRLSKHFLNRETLEDGTQKLRIPLRLLAEKKRTSQRLKVRVWARAQVFGVYICFACLEYLLTLVCDRPWLPATRVFRVPRAAGGATCHGRIRTATSRVCCAWLARPSLRHSPTACNPTLPLC
jgi:hypothetical protein